jgi:hypothetical protein
VAIPIDRNVVQKEAEKVKIQEFRYRDRTTWNVKRTIIPVIIGTTGTVMKSLRKKLDNIPGKHSTDSLQKTAILVTSHIIRKVPGRKPVITDNNDDDDDDDNNNNTCF